MILEGNKNIMKLVLTSFFFSIFVWIGCVRSVPYISIAGKTMGTTYSIKCQSSLQTQILKFKVDSLLAEINQSVSTYIPTSTISKVNTATVNDVSKIQLDDTFVDNFNLSKALYKKSKGAFNPALAPLISYWGFGYENLTKKNVDTNLVNQLKALCNFDDFEMQNNHILKKQDTQQVDFNAVAKGYGVDKVAELLLSKSINNFMVEIGGEIRASGKNSQQNLWSIGIDKPEKNINNRSIKAILQLDNQSVATSGNYRNYRKIGEQEYGHIINPFTGFPQQTDIISATILAKTCAEADAYATACMVLGVEKAKDLIEDNMKLSAYFIYKKQSDEVSTFKTTNLTIQELDLKK